MRVWPLPINSSHTVLRRWFAYGVPLAARREHLSVPEFPGELPLGVRRWILVIGKLLDGLSSFVIAFVQLAIAAAIGAVSLTFMWFALFG